LTVVVRKVTSSLQGFKLHLCRDVYSKNEVLNIYIDDAYLKNDKYL